MKRLHRTSTPKLTPALYAAAPGEPTPLPPPPEQPFWKRVAQSHLGPVAALLLIVLLAFVNTFPAGWTGDRAATIRDDPRLARSSSASFTSVIVDAEANQPPTWSRALPRITWWLNHTSTSARTGVSYHVTNVLLHAAVSLLVYALLVLVMRNQWPAFLGALLFAVHPAAPAAVTDIAGRPELLGALWVLGGLVAYLRGRESRGARRFAYLLLVPLCQALALLSHEFGWALPLLLIVAFLVLPTPLSGDNEEPQLGRDVLHFLGNISLAAIVAAAGALLFGWRLFQQPELTQTSFTLNPLLTADWLQARLTALELLGKYLLHTIWPPALSADYSFHQIPIAAGFNWQIIVPLVALAALFVIALLLRRQARPVLFFTLLFLLPLLPLTNLLWLQPEIMSDRNLYLPLAGFAGWLVAVIYWAARVLVPRVWELDFRRKSWPVIAARLLLGLLAALLLMHTLGRNLDWQNEHALWTATTERSPHSYRAQMQLASAIAAHADAREFTRAVHHVEAALAIIQTPAWPFAQPPPDLLVLAGTIYRLQGDSVVRNVRPVEELQQQAPPPSGDEWYAKSVALLQRAITATPVPVDAYRQLGLASAALGRPADALQAFSTWTAREPGNAEAYSRVATAHIALHRPREAAVALLQTTLLGRKLDQSAEELVPLFHSIDPDRCATQRGANLQLGQKCPFLRELLAIAAREIFDNLERAGEHERAQQFADTTMQQHKLPPETFHDSPAAAGAAPQ